MTKERLYRIVLWIATLTLMTVIFSFSSQTGEESGGLSDMIAVPVTEMLIEQRPEMPPAQEAALYEQVSHFVRKTAHFSEYALLGMLVYLLLRCYGLRQWWLPWIIGTLYAFTDELHQVFTPARSGQLTDVLLDSSGVFCGVMLVLILARIRRNLKHADHS